MKKHWSALVCVAALGCAGAQPTRERGGPALFGGVHTVKAPEKNRCDGLAKGSFLKTKCDEARYLGDLYVRRLSPGDAVCVEGGFGLPPAGACLARAAVVDVATGKALIEIRETKPDSRWFQKEQTQVWFEEGALVDLYLVENGY